MRHALMLMLLAGIITSSFMWGEHSANIRWRNNERMRLNGVTYTFLGEFRCYEVHP